MSHSNRSLPVSPHWLRDEANRLAQTAAPEEQELAVKLMTPLMSDSNQHISPSPPSKGLTAPLEPIFGMAYLNDTEHNPRETRRKSQSGKNTAFLTPTRRSQTANASSSASPLSHRSAASARRRPPTPREANVFSSSSASPTSPTRDLHKSVEQGRETSLAQRLRSPSTRSASHKISPMPSISVPKTGPSASQQSYSAFPASSNFQQPKVHAASTLNVVRLGDGEDLDDQTDDEEIEEEDINGLNEAKDTFSAKVLPDFVIRLPSDGLTRKVVFRPRNKRENSFMDGELVFEFWNEENTQGFWTLRDDAGFRWIVKYSAKGQKYLAWMGVKAGYDQRGIAFPKKHRQSSEAQRLTSQSAVVGDNLFAKRNIDQIHPYTTEKTNYKRSKDGKKKANFKREYTSDASPGLSVPASLAKGGAHRSKGRSRTPPASRLSAAQNKATSKSRLSSGNIDKKATPSPTPEPVSLEHIQNNTTLYIFTNFDFEAAPGAVYLKSCKDINSFFSVVTLVAGVEEHDIRLVTVRFDWLSDSMPDTIRMIRGLSDSYEKMIEEIREAPAWRKAGEGRVGVFVNVVLK